MSLLQVLLVDDEPLALRRLETLFGDIDGIAAILPDGAWLDRFEYSGDTVRISGLAPDVAALMADLGKDPHVRDVRTPIATTRDPATGKERFSIELRWLARPDEVAP